MRTYAPISLLLLLSPVYAGGTTYYALPADKGPAMLRQCSRPSPANVTEFFAVEPSQVSELEVKLALYLHKALPSIHIQQYSRQYVGYMKDGKRYVYGNFFRSDAKVPNAAREPVVVCDGGDWFWSIVYSLNSKTFQDIHFNGSM